MRMVRCDSISGSSPLSKFFFRIVISLPLRESSHIWSAADLSDTRSLQANNLSFVSINTAEKAAPSGNSLNSKPIKELVKQLYYWLLLPKLVITPRSRSEKKNCTRIPYRSRRRPEEDTLGYGLEKITLDGLHSVQTWKSSAQLFKVQESCKIGQFTVVGLVC